MKAFMSLIYFLSIREILKVICLFRETDKRGKDIGKFVRCILVTFVVPKLYHFHELISWCATNYDPYKRMVLFVDHMQPIIDVSPKALA